MKKAGLFFIVPLVIVLLASCSGSQFGKGSLAINLDEELLEKAFPRTQRNYRAGDDSEIYTATLEITGDVTDTIEKEFTRPEKGKEKVFFTVDDLTPGAIIDIKLSLSCDNLVLYEGTKTVEVTIGTTPVNITLKPTGQFNKFTHVKITFESEHGTAPAELVVKKGYVLKESDLPELTETGWIFEGWYAGAERYTADSEVTTSINLVAKWVAVQLPDEPDEPVVDPSGPSEPVVDPVVPDPVTYTVVFAYGDESVAKTFDEAYVLTADDFPAESDISKEGYTFLGWYDDDDNEIEVGYEVSADITITAKYEEIEIEEPEEPEEGVSFVMVMSVNGTAVADGGDILVGDITNATLAINYENPEDSALNIQGKAKLKVGDEELESDTVYMPIQLNLPSILNGRTLEAGTYTIEVYLFNNEIAAEEPLTYTFNVKNEVSVESGIVVDIPDFEVVVTYYQDDDYYGVSVQAVAEYECLDASYDYLWIINGTTFGDASNGLIIYPDGLVSGYGYVPLDFTEANQNVVTCMISNPVTGQIETRSEDFGIKRLDAGSGNAAGNHETIVMQ